MSGKKGGDVFSNIADLAIPFGLLFTLKAIKKVAPVKKATKAKSVKKTRQNGGSHCVLCDRQSGGMSQDMIRSEISKITSDLKSLLQM